jgi:hypothetical protein
MLRARVAALRQAQPSTAVPGAIAIFALRWGSLVFKWKVAGCSIYRGWAVHICAAAVMDS